MSAELRQRIENLEYQVNSLSDKVFAEKVSKRENGGLKEKVRELVSIWNNTGSEMPFAYPDLHKHIQELKEMVDDDG